MNQVVKKAFLANISKDDSFKLDTVLKGTVLYLFEKLVFEVALEVTFL